MDQRSAWQLSRPFATLLIDSRLQNGAAALAFYSILALFPTAIFGLSLLPYLPVPDLKQAIFDLLGELLPYDASELFRTTVQQLIAQRQTGLMSFGLVFAIWTSSSGVLAAIEQLDIVHRQQRSRGALRDRGVALMLLVPLSAQVVITFGLVISGGALQGWLASRIGATPVLLACFAALRWLIITLALLLTFAFMYRVAPTTSRHPFRLLSPGTIFATAGLMIASFGFKYYVGHFGSYNAIYGSLGAVIVLLLWLFAVGWVFLIGAGIDEVLYQRDKPSPADPTTARDVDA
ncbi:MAG: YihY/virulence factor BrkB family protein [Polyangiales bacterium]